MSDERLRVARRRRWMPALGPLAWVIAVVTALAIQLFVCASGTDAAATPVRVAIVVLAAVAFVASILAALPSWRDRAAGSSATALVISASVAVGSVLLILVAVVVPTASIC